VQGVRNAALGFGLAVAMFGIPMAAGAAAPKRHGAQAAASASASGPPVIDISVDATPAPSGAEGPTVDPPAPPPMVTQFACPPGPANAPPKDLEGFLDGLGQYGVTWDAAVKTYVAENEQYDEWFQRWDMEYGFRVASDVDALEEQDKTSKDAGAIEELTKRKTADKKALADFEQLRKRPSSHALSLGDCARAHNEPWDPQLVAAFENLLFSSPWVPAATFLRQGKPWTLSYSPKARSGPVADTDTLHLTWDVTMRSASGKIACVETTDVVAPPGELAGFDVAAVTMTSDDLERFPAFLDRDPTPVRMPKAIALRASGLFRVTTRTVDLSKGRDACPEPIAGHAGTVLVPVPSARQECALEILGALRCVRAGAPEPGCVQSAIEDHACGAICEAAR
jgi:hypothetical protein